MVSRSELKSVYQRYLDGDLVPREKQEDYTEAAALRQTVKHLESLLEEERDRRLALEREFRAYAQATQPVKRVIVAGQDATH